MDARRCIRNLGRHGQTLAESVGSTDSVVLSLAATVGGAGSSTAVLGSSPAVHRNHTCRTITHARAHTQREQMRRAVAAVPSALRTELTTAGQCHAQTCAAHTAAGVPDTPKQYCAQPHNGGMCAVGANRKSAFRLDGRLIDLVWMPRKDQVGRVLVLRVLRVLTHHLGTCPWKENGTGAEKASTPGRTRSRTGWGHLESTQALGLKQPEGADRPTCSFMTRCSCSSHTCVALCAPPFAAPLTCTTDEHSIAASASSRSATICAA